MAEKITPYTLPDYLPDYALGLLTEDEQRQVEALLADDEAARQMLRDYQALGDALLFTAPARSAPAHLQSDLRARLSRARFEPASAVRTVTRDAYAYPGQQADRRIQRLRWLAVTMAYLLVMAMIAMSMLLADRLTTRSPQEEARALYNTLNAEPMVRRIVVEPDNPAAALRGEVLAAADGLRAVMRLDALPPLDPDQAYELWLIDATGATSGGTFTSAAVGPTYITIPLSQSLTHYERLGVSLEPAGGSPLPGGPSGPRILSVPVSDI